MATHSIGIICDKCGAEHVIKVIDPISAEKLVFTCEACGRYQQNPSENFISGDGMREVEWQAAAGVPAVQAARQPVVRSAGSDGICSFPNSHGIWLAIALIMAIVLASYFRKQRRAQRAWDAMFTKDGIEPWQ